MSAQLLNIAASLKLQQTPRDCHCHAMYIHQAATPSSCKNASILQYFPNTTLLFGECPSRTILPRLSRIYFPEFEYLGKFLLQLTTKAAATQKSSYLGAQCKEWRTALCVSQGVDPGCVQGLVRAMTPPMNGCPEPEARVSVVPLVPLTSWQAPAVVHSPY